MTDAIDLTKAQRNQLTNLLRRFLPGVAVWAYGSRVKWTARPNSDLDLVAFTAPAQRPQVAELKDALAESNLPFPVDLHVWDDVPERFREIIRKEYVVVQEASQPDSRTSMAGEWALVTVGELAKSISDTHKLEKEQLIFLNTSDILLGKILHRTYTSVRDWPGQAKKSIRRDDILFSEIRPANGRWVFVDFDADDYVVSTKLMVIRGDRNRVVPRFLYHFLTSSETTRWLQHLADSRSGTFPQITFDQVADLELALPPLDVQEAIAHFLDCIEDKIELNRWMNETLEAIVRALFKSWFVDFAPVRAKAEGRDPGLPQPIADLFPDSFEDSELGEIPNGWKVKSVGGLADVVGGTTPSTKEPAYWNGGTHAWATPKDLSGLSVPVLLDTERRITDTGLSQVGSGLLPKGTVLLSSRAPIGYLAVAEIPVAINQGFIAMVPKTGTPNLFLLLWASVAHDEIVSRANGSTFLEISKANFRPIPIVTPSDCVMQKFEQLARPLYERIVNNVCQSRTLATLRDALLPKLISGELRVPEETIKLGGRA